MVVENSKISLNDTILEKVFIIEDISVFLKGDHMKNQKIEK